MKSGDGVIYVICFVLGIIVYLLAGIGNKLDQLIQVMS